MNSKPEQHTIPVSIVLHLLPGILTGIVFFTAAPFVQKMNFPPFVAHAFADLVILVPLGMSRVGAVLHCRVFMVPSLVR